MDLATYQKLERITGKELAKRLGLSESELSKFLRGHRVPTLQRALEIERRTRGAVRPQDWVVGPPSSCDRSPTRKSVAA